MPAATDIVVAVTVVRSGGFAGLTRRWGVQAPPAEAEPWLALVEDCPWEAAEDAPPAETRGADRFSWSVRATLGGDSHRADLTESQASGPWRTLIDAVRAASDEAGPPASRA